MDGRHQSLNILVSTPPEASFASACYEGISISLPAPSGEFSENLNEFGV